MADDSTTELLRGALEGDQRCWDGLVERYERLVWSVIRGFRLGDAASADAAQMVWFRLAENADRIEQPERLGSWLATTARREALRFVRERDRVVPVDEWTDHVDPHATPTDDSILEGDTIDEVMAAFAQLSEVCQQLLRLCCASPPLDYVTIAEILDRPVGSIGPTRGRCLTRLRTLMTANGDRHGG